MGLDLLSREERMAWLHPWSHTQVCQEEKRSTRGGTALDTGRIGVSWMRVSFLSHNGELKRVCVITQLLKKGHKSVSVWKA